MRFACSPVDASFFDTAPMRFVNSAELPAPVAEIFAGFKDPAAWPRWFHGIRHVEWTSPEPYGAATTRTVTLDTMTVHEHFFRWEENQRISFYFTATSVPFATHFAEDYLLEPLDAGRCRFTYTVALAPSLLLKLGGPIARNLLGNMFRRAPEGLARYAATTMHRAA